MPGIFGRSLGLRIATPGGYDGWMLWSTAATSLSVSIPPALDLTVYRDWQNNLHTLPSTLTITQTPVLLETVDNITM